MKKVKSKYRRSICALLSVLLLVTLLPMGVFADADETQPSVSIRVESASAAPGATVVIPVYVENNPGILGARLAFEFDDGLTLTKAERGEAFDTLTMTKPGRFVSPCQFLWDGQEIAEEDVKDGVILTLTFEVSPEASSGDRLGIRISYTAGDIVDADLQPLDVDMVSGTISVIDYIPGDVNMDQVIGTTDVIALRRHLAGGYDLDISLPASDVNADALVNPTDVVLLRRYLAGGYDIELQPSPLAGVKVCQHELEAIPFKAATASEPGNIAYWVCSLCGKYFSDESGKNVISPSDVIIKPSGELESGEHRIYYDIANGDSYVAKLLTDGAITNPNPDKFSEGSSLTLKSLTVSAEEYGYKFSGWYDAADGGERVYRINKGTTDDVTVYARWTKNEYDITYKVYMTPLGDITDERYLHYTPDKGLQNLPNPEINNYVFMGWSTDDGELIDSIPVGTTGDITLNANWISKRNMTKAVKRLADPIILEDSDEGVIYFAYELGTIENVPLSDAVWTIQSVAGLAQQESRSFTSSISAERAQTIGKTISSSTVDSSTWSLSKDWNESTTVDEEWAQQHETTVEKAKEEITTSTDSLVITTGQSGTQTNSKTDGTTAVTSNSTDEKKGSSKELNVHVGGSYTSSLEYGGSLGNEAVGFSAKKSSSFTLEAAVDANYKRFSETNEHVGTENTTVETKVSSDSSSWNNSSTASSTKSASESSKVSHALSDIVSKSQKYGSSYSSGGQNSEAQEFSKTSSDSTNTSSTLTYFDSETTTRTSTYSTDGKSEGCYRLVLAGKIHVFGVVGYDIASRSYFTYTYNILDDKTYDFLDYSTDLQFNDNETGVLPFDIPYDVYEYVTGCVAQTEGLHFRVDTKSKTATVSGYDGEYEDVIVPSYISSGGAAYKVTAIAPGAFADTSVPIRAVVLSEYIDEIPDSAFLNCTELEEVSGFFTRIGSSAFEGCASLEGFIVPSAVTYIGENAFRNAGGIIVNASSAEVARAAVASGANKLVLDISAIKDADGLSLSVPEMELFELRGGRRSYNGLHLSSAALSTVLTQLSITGSDRIPLEIASQSLTLDTVSVDSSSYALMLSAAAPEIILKRDNYLVSEAGKAMVCGNPSFRSAYEDSTDGQLEVDGDIYACISDSRKTELEALRFLTVVSPHEIRIISEEEFSRYMQGSYTLTFDAQGGETSVGSKAVWFNTEVGELPTPTKHDYVFLGWFTSVEGGDVITSETAYTFTGDVTLYAHWALDAYTLTFDPGEGSCTETQRTVSYNTPLGKLPTPTRTGFVFSGWYTKPSGGDRATESSAFSGIDSITLYAVWAPEQYVVTWGVGTGYEIRVSRTSSPCAGASIGALERSAAIYYGDTLSISYAAATGYTVTSNGKTEITVSGNVDTRDIYASAQPNKYTYSIHYVSTNGTDLGWDSSTNVFGTTNTFSPPAKSGYDTPPNQDILWDQTSKTVTFTYAPSYVNSSTRTGTASKYVSGSNPGITYSAVVEHRNRTANSVQLRVKWTSTIRAYSYTYYGQNFKATTNAANTGTVKVASFGTWGNSSSSARSASGTSDWINASVNTTNATSVSLSIYYWQTNSNGTDMAKYNGTDSVSETWQIFIPAY